MTDLIDRQAAIDVVHRAIYDFFDICSDDDESPITYKDEKLLEINKAITAQICKLPSAQPERKRGEWIEDGYNNNKAVCSECGEPCGTYFMGKPRDNFCKWCGAEMVKGDNNATLH